MRAQVDAIGARYFVARARAAALDAEVRMLDQQLARSRKHAAALRPIAAAEAVQLYQNSSETFTVLFDTTSAMESARRAELILRASDHTQALLNDYANAAASLSQQRRSVEQARAAQAAVVAALAAQQTALEHALAQAQQAYRNQQLAARARARVISTTSKGTPVPVPIADPPAPVPVDPPPPTHSGDNPHHGDAFLVCTRARESSGVYTAVNPAGYYGAYQFSQPTWDLTANHAGMPQLIGVRPDAASAWDQDQLAWVLYQWQGNGPWGGLC